jgi:hypothetical protein
VAIALAVLAGCSLTTNHGDEGMVVLGNTAASGTTCMFTGDPAQPLTTHGIIDALAATPYLLTPLVQSRITPIENGDPLQRTILFGGANVDLAVVAASANGATASVTLPSDATHFKVVFSGALPPMGDANVSFDLVPADAIQAIAMQTNALTTPHVDVEVQSTVTIFGTLGTDGNAKVEAGPFSYGVTVCNDCVVNDLGSCLNVTGTVRTGNPCNLFQDGIVDCCQNMAGMETCPAVAGT